MTSAVVMPWPGKRLPPGRSRRGWRHVPPARRWKSGRPMRGLLLAALSLSGRSFRFVFQEPEQAASAWFTCSMSRPKCVTSMCKKAGRKYKSAKSRHWVMKKAHHRNCLPKGEARPQQISARARWARSRPKLLQKSVSQVCDRVTAKQWCLLVMPGDCWYGSRCHKS